MFPGVSVTHTKYNNYKFIYFYERSILQDESSHLVNWGVPLLRPTYPLGIGRMAKAWRMSSTDLLESILSENTN